MIQKRSIFDNNMFDLLGFTYVSKRFGKFKELSRFHHYALPFLFETLVGPIRKLANWIYVFSKSWDPVLHNLLNIFDVQKVEICKNKMVWNESGLFLDYSNMINTISKLFKITSALLWSAWIPIFCKMFQDPTDFLKFPPWWFHIVLRSLKTILSDTPKNTFVLLWPHPFFNLNFQVDKFHV